jgi:hypothetical protein
VSLDVVALRPVVVVAPIRLSAIMANIIAKQYTLFAAALEPREECRVAGKYVDHLGRLMSCAHSLARGIETSPGLTGIYY